MTKESQFEDVLMPKGLKYGECRLTKFQNNKFFIRNALKI